MVEARAAGRCAQRTLHVPGETGAAIASKRRPRQGSVRDAEPEWRDCHDLELQPAPGRAPS